jgi:hypothetical protein
VPLDQQVRNLVARVDAQQEILTNHDQQLVALEGRVTNIEHSMAFLLAITGQQTDLQHLNGNVIGAVQQTGIGHSVSLLQHRQALCYLARRVGQLQLQTAALAEQQDQSAANNNSH